VPRAPALGLPGLRLSEGFEYGTIRAEVVTHRLLLLEGLRFPESIDARATSELLNSQCLTKVSGGEAPKQISKE